MATTTCEHCGGPLPALSRADARYCSGRCRTAACRARRRAAAERVPVDLRRADRWVRRSSTKVPLTSDGRAASSTDPATWCSYRSAARSDVGAGLGFVLDRGDDIVCVDLDHCLDGAGRPLPWAAEILARTPATWVEVSPSGRGLHIWGRARFRGGRRRGHVEVYGDGRYIAVTGRAHRSAPPALADITALVETLT